MKREVNLAEITDGNLYELNDMVRADCHDCKGCSACCRGMGNSIVLDPYDVHCLCSGLQTTFDALLATSLELNVVDGIILPNIKMQSEKDCCTYLDENGRCSIHAFRPGFCRMFPLGRLYEDRTFHYILQTHECPQNRSKIKISKWLGLPDIKRNQEFIHTWHYFLEDLSAKLQSECTLETTSKVQQFLLHLFYRTPYDDNANFYDQFDERMKKAMTLIQA